MSDQGYTPTTDEEMVERIADTLAYYQCRETNPKADHPIFGYHQFSREQRDWLRKEKREAAEEVARIIAEVRREAAEAALREAHADLAAYTESGAPFGGGRLEDFLLRRADEIEKEAGK